MILLNADKTLETYSRLKKPERWIKDECSIGISLNVKVWNNDSFSLVATVHKLR